MKKIRVYNIAGLIEKEMPDKRAYFNSAKLCIMEGNNGVIIFDDEACGWIKNSTENNIKIGLIDAEQENGIPCMAQYTVEIPVKDLMTAEFEEMPITKFVDRYNRKSRIMDNLKNVLEVMDKIGLNRTEYFAG
jgi:hypothetical protein